jgi:ATP-dependent Clp protease ATP-binding subunit ClpC
MFERYNERARRAIFFARYEASEFGSPAIETEHLLLGLLRADQSLVERLAALPASTAWIRKRIEARVPMREKIPTSVDLPLSEECMRVLLAAAETNDKSIDTEHLLIALQREEKSVAVEILRECGL